MPRFCVQRKELYYQDVVMFVDATDVDEAIEKVAEGDCEMVEGDMHYIRTLDRDEWNVCNTDGELLK